MQTSKLTKQILDFQKSTFETFYGTMTRIQNQMESTTTNLLKRSSIVPEEGLRALDAWSSAIKQGQSDVKKMIDDGFDAWESLLTKSVKETKAS
jgi:hypothetical protein